VKSVGRTMWSHWLTSLAIRPALSVLFELGGEANATDGRRYIIAA